jgi:hypothetical protein
MEEIATIKVGVKKQIESDRTRLPALTLTLTLTLILYPEQDFFPNHF